MLLEEQRSGDGSSLYWQKRESDVFDLLMPVLSTILSVTTVSCAHGRGSEYERLRDSQDHRSLEFRRTTP